MDVRERRIKKDAEASTGRIELPFTEMRKIEEENVGRDDIKNSGLDMLSLRCSLDT